MMCCFMSSFSHFSEKQTRYSPSAILFVLFFDDLGESNVTLSRVTRYPPSGGILIARSPLLSGRYQIKATWALPSLFYRDDISFLLPSWLVAVLRFSRRGKAGEGCGSGGGGGGVMLIYQHLLFLLLFFFFLAFCCSLGPEHSLFRFQEQWLTDSM